MEEPKNNISIYDYAYTCGRIRAMENSLMNSSQIMRLFDAANTEEIEKVLSENGYKVKIDVNESITADLVETFMIVKSMVPDTSIVNILMLENDYHNVKVILKSIISSSNGSKVDVEMYDDLQDDELVKEDDFSYIIENAVP